MLVQQVASATNGFPHSNEFPECVFYYSPPFYDAFPHPAFYSLSSRRARREWCKNIAWKSNKNNKKKSVCLVSHESVVEKSFRRWKRIIIPVENVEVHLINFKSSSGMFVVRFVHKNAWENFFLPFKLRNQLSFVSYSNPLILIFMIEEAKFQKLG